MLIQWLRYNKRLPISIEVGTDDGEYIVMLCSLIVKDNLEAIHIPPRGQQIMLVNEKSGDPENPQATSIIGRRVCGDVVIISPDVWARMEGC